ncbi:DNA-binding transcriptional activator of the SARP family [Lentzea fradiae]|uniref:DNA-binding transcriptional activator of the SARP family n=1 Tax=Lentzea fradiae TaxID=200378 RepID=A0A1G8BKP8_9PSEU|nr:AfsR/SARP family transcriptional regulator [Lentzea fradiae]SDH33731.1 DNA-binding transcriptional activator of the SARP family [Lentzea fradiae]
MEFRILGPVGLWLNGAELPLKGSKQRTILAALLLAREKVLSDAQLGEVLWGKNPPATYQAQIYTYASRLRRHLHGGMALIRQGSGYFMRIGTARFDFHEFENLSRTGREALRLGRFDEASELLRGALSLWRGPTLTDVTDLLAETERPGIEEVRLKTLESRIDAELALGRHHELISELVGLVNADPLRERTRAQLMIALYQGDRQAEAFATFQEGSRLLSDELGVDPGPTLRNAYQAILTHDVRPAFPVQRNSVTTTPRPATPAAGTPDFTGREAELDVVTDRLRTRSSLVTVTGMPGVGKTVFALHVADRLRAEFPDGRLHVDLRGGGTPLSPGEALGALLGGLGVSGSSLPSSLDQRATLYRDLLAERRMIVVLDDAATDPQVRPLLTGAPHCRTIITTRRVLTTLGGQHTLTLPPLGDDEALALFTSIAGPERTDAEKAAAARIVRLCHGLPLAVRIAGARAAAKLHWSLERMAARFADPDRLLDELRLGDLDVRERFRGGCESLDPLSRSALLRLSLLDSPSFPHSATSSLLGLPDASGEQVTEHLLDMHLLELAGIEPGGEQAYRFHPLARLVAREIAVTEDGLSAALSLT